MVLHVVIEATKNIEGRHVYTVKNQYGGHICMVAYNLLPIAGGGQKVSSLLSTTKGSRFVPTRRRLGGPVTYPRFFHKTRKEQGKYFGRTFVLLFLVLVPTWHTDQTFSYTYSSQTLFY